MNIVKKILEKYDSDNAGTLSNIYKLLMHGKLAGTGKLVILPVDQGFEHGPTKSFAPNEKGFDPDYHFELAIEAGLSAYAAPLGFIESGARKYAGQIPLILKLNNSDMLSNSDNPCPAVTGSVQDALRLGCAAIGFTIYPGSTARNTMYEKIRELTLEAKSNGLAVVVWSYPRGSGLSKNGETAIDIAAYAAHIAAQLGAHIIKVKLPTAHIELEDNAKMIEKHNIPVKTQAERVKYVVKSAFNGKRIVIFSGGASKDIDSLYKDAEAIRDGGGFGSIIGRNTFQRPMNEALEMLDKIINIYKVK